MSNEYGGALGTFYGLWYPLSHDSCLSGQLRWASHVPWEGMNNVKPECKCECSVWMWPSFPKERNGVWGRTVGMIKSTIPPTSQDLLLICIKAWLVAFGGACSPLCHMQTRGLLLHTQKLTSLPWGVKICPQKSTLLPPQNLESISINISVSHRTV